MSNRAWVTLATNDSYGLGALVLASSLRRAGSQYPAVVLITPSVTDSMRERLRSVFVEVVTVDVLDSKDAAHLALLQRPELGITFTKIHCWSLVQYEKCVFLDADTLVVQNCDELFDREELSAAPDVGWPDCFNSGVFVFRPSNDTFSNIIKFAQERGSFDGGDQGLLNSYFSNWATGDITKHLPFLYNVTSGAFYSYIPALKHYGQNLKIIHFIGIAKPWLQKFNWQTRSVDAPDHLQEYLQLWWDLFVSQVHAQLEDTMVELKEAPPEKTPQDVSKYYEPTIDSESEFSWHHPDKEPTEADNSFSQTTTFNDPWETHSGNIKPTDEVINLNVKCMEDYQELRRYALENKRYQNYSNMQLSDKEHCFTNKYQNSNSYCASNDAIGKNENHNDQQSFTCDSSYHDHPSELCSNNPKIDEYQNCIDMCYHNNEDRSQSSQSDVQVYHVEVGHKKDQECDNTCINVNGYSTEEVCDEEYIPTHPYDGFYLRHTVLFDPLGRKICSHQKIPCNPVASQARNDTSIDSESEQTGVAGNLAKVVPGEAGCQTEALDELTRRQGWEAGNIDYMGADSFDNIWAKISQTLNKSRASPPKQTSAKEPIPQKQTSPPKETKPAKEPTPPKQETIPKEPSPPKQQPAPKPDVLSEVETTTQAEQTQDAKPIEVAKEEAKRTEKPVPATPPATPKSTPEPSTPLTEETPSKNEPLVPDTPKDAEPAATPPAKPKSTPEPSTPLTEETASKIEPLVPDTSKVPTLAPLTSVSLAPAAEAPASPSSTTGAALEASIDSPPLANTPSKEESQAVPTAKSEEKRKPVGKLLLSAPAPSDPLPTPDSELEDADTLAQKIIASELRTTVTSPSPSTPLSPPPSLQEKKLSVEEQQIPTPPVSLAQIGVKPKVSTAAQIKTSLAVKEKETGATPKTPSTPSTPTTPECPSEAKRKGSKKLAKKESTQSGDASVPVPPPRKKEKKPKEK